MPNNKCIHNIFSPAEKNFDITFPVPRLWYQKALGESGSESVGIFLDLNQCRFKFQG